MKRYRLTLAAAEDLEEITNFLATKAPAAVDRIINSIQKKCQSLAEMPGMGRSREEFAPNLRSAHVGKYLVFLPA